jgi:leucyl aminopeptidase
MRPSVERRQPWDIEADVLVITLPAGDRLPEPVAEVDRRLEGAISELRGIGALPGTPWSSRLLPARGLATRLVLVVGTGEGEGLDRLGLRRLGAVIMRALGGIDVASLAVHVPNALVEAGETGLGDAIELLARGLVEGTADPSAIYRETAPGRPPEVSTVIFAVENGDPGELAARAERGRIVGEGGNRTRRLAHRAANDVSPEVLADEAADLARRHDLELTVFGADEAERLGMGMFLAVGRGSDNPPRFIALRSKPGLAQDGRGRLLAMVGKGVTFYTGGISLKPPANMHEM